MPPKFLYFDMGNVLLSFSHEQAAAQIAAVAGISYERAWQIVFDEGLQEQYERGTINWGQFYHLFCLAADCSPDPALLDDAASAIFKESPGIVSLLMKLRTGGQRMGVLSNTSPSHWRHVTKQFPFLTELLCEYALSYELGAMKPDEAVYAAAEELAGVSGPEIFFTDDRAENVAAAQSRGWDAVLFASPLKLQADLAARGFCI